MADMKNKELQLPDFIQIPRQIMEDQTLSQLDWSVYGLIYWYSKLKLQKCILSNSSFAKLTNTQPRSIQRSLVRLEDAGYICCEYNEKKTEREIHPLVNYSIQKKEGRPMTVQSSPHDSSVVGGRPLGHPNNINIIIKSNNKEKNILKKEKGYPLNKITEIDIEQIAERYKVSVGFVKLQLEKMTNWCEAKGKHYKNYKFALRNWVVGSMEKQIEGRMQGNVRPTVDARGLSQRL
jgi:hypothetical protein